MSFCIITASRSSSFRRARALGHKEPPWTYFCMGCGPNMPAFDMPYEKLGVVSVEAAYSDHPHDVVILGRRLPAGTMYPWLTADGPDRSMR